MIIFIYLIFWRGCVCWVSGTGKLRLYFEPKDTIHNKGRKGIYCRSTANALLCCVLGEMAVTVSLLANLSKLLLTTGQIDKHNLVSEFWAPPKNQDLSQGQKKLNTAKKRKCHANFPLNAKCSYWAPGQFLNECISEFQVAVRSL